MFFDMFSNTDRICTNIVEPSSTVVADRVARAVDGVDERGPFGEVHVFGASGQDCVRGEVSMVRVAMKKLAPDFATDDVRRPVLIIAAQRTSGRDLAGPGSSMPTVVAKKDAGRRNAGRGVR